LQGLHNPSKKAGGGDLKYTLHQVRVLVFCVVLSIVFSGYELGLWH